MNRRTTYTFKWPGRKKPNGLAMNCHMKDGQLRFYDTNRGHMIDGKVVKDGDGAFTFQSAGFEPGEWEFKALTIEDVRRGVVWIENGDIIAKTIQTTDDLQEWYRKTFGQDAGLNYPDVLDE